MLQLHSTCVSVNSLSAKEKNMATGKDCELCMRFEYLNFIQQSQSFYKTDCNFKWFHYKSLLYNNEVCHAGFKATLRGAYWNQTEGCKVHRQQWEDCRHTPCNSLQDQSLIFNPTMMEIPVFTLDAFTNLPLKGNPAAICPLKHVSKNI